MSASLVLLNLLGAVALLLWGLRMVRTAAERALGADLDRHLRRIAGHRLRAFVFGGIGAATLQSSTALVLLGGGFVAKARLTLAAGLALALGADVGTALAAQILSLDISAAIPALLLAGYVLFQSGTSKRVRNGGRACLGLGLMLTALTMIVGVAGSLQASETIPLVIAALSDEPTLSILLAAVLTWIAHSSLAVVLMIAALTLAGVIGGPAALYLLLGANLGAALPALSATMAEPMAGRRVPIGNLCFRGLGVFGMVWAVPAFYALLNVYGLTDQKIVVLGHLAFNMTLAVVGLPLVGVAAGALEKFLPSLPDLERPRAAPRHLHEEALNEPARALGNARREALRLADFVHEMLDDSHDALSPDAPVERLTAIGVIEDEVDSLNNAIKFYVTEITRAELSRDQSRQAHSIISFSTNMEHIGDIVDRNIRRLADRKHKSNLTFSEEGAAEIDEIYDHVRESMQLAVSAFMADDEAIAEQLIARKRNFRDEEYAANQQHLERLREGNAASIDTSSIHLDLLRDLKRIHSHLTSIAYTITDRQPVQMRDTA
ncbi:MAG: Na/Pi cotransporter family protein [Pseudomonadota bacterium]